MEAESNVGRRLNVTIKLRSLLLRTITSARTQKLQRWFRETRRILSGRPHTVSVFLQIDDPYSYLLSHYLPGLLSAYDIELQFYLSQAQGADFQPAPDMLAEYAVVDCMRLASELGLPFLDIGTSPLTEHRVRLADAVAATQGHAEFGTELCQALAIFWRGDGEAASRRVGAERSSEAVIATSQKLQLRLGHYNSAMLHYEGEWFWGIDRLHYLTERLDQLGLAKGDLSDPLLASLKQLMQITLPVKPPAATQHLPPLELFFSFRSPYSYLSLQRTYELADAFGLKLILRPVLPMVMRGMKVPRAKLVYIALDTAREARRLNIPFGNLRDPLGAGVERTLSVFDYAASQNRAREFALVAAAAIWSEAIDVSTDDGLRMIAGRTGLFWPEALAAISSEKWRESVEANRESMMNSGSWGVPTMRIGEFVVWGQDRDWLIARHIEELCATEEGILI